jgi:hypothetical protein
MDNKKIPGFFYPGLSFSNNICSYHRINSDGKNNGNILINIKKYANENFRSLLDLSENNHIIKFYCYSKENEFVEFWNMTLTTGWAFKQLEMDNALFNNIKPQAKIHSLDLIKACYFFNQAYIKYNGFFGETISLDFLLTNKKRRLIEIKDSTLNFFEDVNEAIAYGSYHAGYLLLDVYLNFRGVKNEELSFEKIKQQLQGLAKHHGSPGHLLLATLYLNAEQYQQCDDCLQAADSLLTDSDNEIHNSGNSKEQITEKIAQLRELLQLFFSEKNTEIARRTLEMKSI